jgi:hypothetical protein
MNRERQLAEAVKEMLDHLPSGEWTHEFRNLQALTNAALAQPKREAGEVVREMRGFCACESMAYHGYQLITREALTAWADALEASQARVAELEAKQ